jgi:hypothetical protein
MARIPESVDARDTWNSMSNGERSGTTVGVSIELAFSELSLQTFDATFFNACARNPATGPYSSFHRRWRPDS